MSATISDSAHKGGKVRHAIVGVVFAITIENHADLATIAIAGPVMSKVLGLTPVQMGFVSSALGWSYVIGRIPGGRALDLFGSKMVYFCSIFLWSSFTVLVGLVGTAAVYMLFALRSLIGFVQAPCFSADCRIQPV